MATEWFCQIMNDTIGPLSSRQLLDKVRSGHVKEDTLIRKDDSQWVHAREVSGLFSAASNAESKRLCPYCGHDVQAPPTVCLGCNRKLVLSFSSRLTALGRKDPGTKPKLQDRATEIQELQARTDRADIIRYVVLLVLWFTLLICAPYLIYLAASGRLIFKGDLAAISVVGVSGFVAGIYYLISRLAS